MKGCKDCIFSEKKNTEFVYCRNFERNVLACGTCSKLIVNMEINEKQIMDIKK